uniref:Putative secreted protein n=1 Tax=Panstrongylus lignarius TaxID=156445 RepID=A0A224Y251_9HEMI
MFLVVFLFILITSLPFLNDVQKKLFRHFPLEKNKKKNFFLTYQSIENRKTTPPKKNLELNVTLFLIRLKIFLCSRHMKKHYLRERSPSFKAANLLAHSSYYREDSV